MILIALLGLIIGLGPVSLAGTAPGQTQAASLSSPAPIPCYRLPERLTLSGEVVPLNDPEVWEALDQEFIMVVYNRVQTILWIKRAARYFPHLEKKLQQARLPDDLKYVALVESDLRPWVRSPKGALGSWQFIKPTANRFFLKTEKNIDERLDFFAATTAAMKYLKFLHRKFRHWSLAIAAYNCGEGRLQRAIAEQGVQDFYHLSLPKETERYVYRIIAAKIVLSNPGRYGYKIPPDQLYSPRQYDLVEFTVNRPIHLRQVAQACGSYYKAIKRLNPWIRGATLRPGVYRLKVPRGSASRFYRNYLNGLAIIP